MQKFEEDLNWLSSKMRNTSPSEKRMFIEKVAVLVAEGHNESSARFSVLEMINNARGIIA